MALTACSWVNLRGHVGAAQDEQEGDQPAGDVEAVEAGGEVEDRAVRRGRDRDALVDQRGVLQRLAADEERAHDVGEHEPLAQAPALDLEARSPVRPTWPRSAAKTPSWQVSEESTRTVVLTAANGTLSFSVSCAHRSGETARIVK